MSKFTDAIVSTLQSYFQTGDQPTASQFAELITDIHNGVEEHTHQGGDGDGPAIVAAGLGSNAVTQAKINSGAVGSGEIATGGVGSSEIADRTRKFLVPAIVGHNEDTGADIRPTDWGGGNMAALRLPGSDETYAAGSFMVPQDFSSGLTVEAILSVPAASATIVGKIQTYYGAGGEAWNNHSDSSSKGTISVPADQRVLKATTSLTSAATGDMVSVNFVRYGDDANDTGGAIYVLGFIVSYTADS